MQKHVFLHINIAETAAKLQLFTYDNNPFGLLHNMPANRTPMASVEQATLSKVPVLTAGDISPMVMHQFKHTCMNYFVHKKVIANDQVSLVIGGILDDRVGDWLISDCDCLVNLSFNDFMDEFRTNYLAEDWEEYTICEILSMTQENNTFWDYAITLQSKNSLLRGTTLHLLDDKLCHQLSVGMETRLSKKVSTEKVNKVVEFCKWLNEVQQCDKGLCGEREEYERSAKENRDVSQ